MPPFQPVLLGGLFNGVLSSLPFISLGNCCCLWVTGGGMVTAYLLQERTPRPIELRDGVFGGFLAGIVGAFIIGLVGLVTAPMQIDSVEEELRTLPPEMLQFVDVEALIAGTGLLLTMISFFLSLVIGAIFSTLGGLLGALFFRRNTPRVIASPPSATAAP